MGERITAAEARDRVAQIKAENIAAHQALILPMVYELIAKAVDEELTSITLDEAIETYPKASLLAVKQVLVEEDGYVITGTTISWAE